MAKPSTAPAPDAAVLANATVALYRAALGPGRTAHYLPLFARFDERGLASAAWNHAAAWFSLGWLLYRRLWRPALLYALLLGLALGAWWWWARAPLAAGAMGVPLGLLSLIGVLAVAVPGLWGSAWLHSALRERMTEAVRRANTVQEACDSLRRVGPARWVWLPGVLAQFAVLAQLSGVLPAPWAGGSVDSVATGPAPFSSPPVAVPGEPPPAPARVAEPAAEPAAEPVAAIGPPLAVVSPPAVRPPDPVPEKPAAAPVSPVALTDEPAPPLRAAGPESAALAPVPPRPSHAAPAETRLPSQSLSSTLPPSKSPPSKSPPSKSAPSKSAPSQAAPVQTATAAAPAALAAASADSVPIHDSPRPRWQGAGINVGMFGDAANAERAAARLRQRGLPVQTDAVESSRGVLTRVRVGPFEQREQAEAAALTVREMGLEAKVFGP